VVSRDPRESAQHTLDQLSGTLDRAARNNAERDPFAPNPVDAWREAQDVRSAQPVASGPTHKDWEAWFDSRLKSKLTGLTEAIGQVVAQERKAALAVLGDFQDEHLSITKDRIDALEARVRELEGSKKTDGPHPSKH
jgi:hypothetical protein